MDARISSLQVGRPQTLGDGVSTNPMFGQWSTGIFKQPVTGRIRLRQTNLDGDGQADLTVHGGPDKAVLVYAAAHYPAWRSELKIEEFPFGAFGENFTVEGMSEDTVFLGDIYQIGDAIVQVAQPRMPCWKLARKWQRPDLPARVVKTGRSGWYLRVLKEGSVAAGDALELQDRPFPDWPIGRASEVSYGSSHRQNEALELSRVEALPLDWRNWLTERVMPGA